MQIDFIFAIVILIMSVVVHEVSHGWLANMLGDPTARLAGRLTLNPLKHLDPVGSFLVPGVLILLSKLSGGGGLIFGWAKPVPYNPYNLRGGKWGPAAVAAAGPLANLLVMVIFAIALRVISASAFGSPATLTILSLIVLVNLWLAVFNLVPIPPLDGSKVLFAVLPLRFRELEAWMNRWQLVLILLLLFFVLRPLSVVILKLFNILVG